MNMMSAEMIVAETAIDSFGRFNFNIDFLPVEKNIYRLHLVKKGNPPAMLIIGGKDENHLFLIANRYSNIEITSVFSYPPFRNVTFSNTPENINFQKIKELVFQADSVSSESGAAKRKLIANNLEKQLLQIADTSNSFLVSLYAIYNSNFASNYTSNIPFYKTYLKKWRNNNNPYYKAFKQKIPLKTKNNILLTLLIVFVGSSATFILWKNSNKTKNKLKKLSIQERNIFELLQKGASNQEISDHYNIGVSTVKSHVSSIFSKLNIKSRKDIINFK
ncbi:MAG: helix-turn-helix transcriptional regulator [Prolixibacteraceae bacterium]|nr:helix-turn-helix transcriptional regulator [Prolixibacteraceae bacterium]